MKVFSSVSLNHPKPYKPVMLLMIVGQLDSVRSILMNTFIWINTLTHQSILRLLINLSRVVCAYLTYDILTSFFCNVI